jgi:hypothetical protein
VIVLTNSDEGDPASYTDYTLRERYLNHILSASADCGKLGA